MPSLNHKFSKVGNILLLLAITAAIFPTFYALGMLLGTIVGAYYYSPRYNNNNNNPSTITIKQATTTLTIDASQMSSNEITLLQSLSSSSFLRESMLDLLVKEYVSSKTLDPDIESRRGSAIEAWQFTEIDNEPIPIVGYPYLFVGSVAASLNYPSLQKNGITHIVNWSSSAKCHSFTNIHYLCYSDIRSPEEMERSIDRLHDAVEYIALAHTVSGGGKIMSHCWYGRNRSVTLLVAYLMTHENLSSEEALHIIQKTRPKAAPYQNVLDAYKERYL